MEPIWLVGMAAVAVLLLYLAVSGRHRSVTLRGVVSAALLIAVLVIVVVLLLLVAREV